MKTKNAHYRFEPFLNSGNSNGRCSETFLTGNPCGTVPVIGGDVEVHIVVLCKKNLICQSFVLLNKTVMKRCSH